MTKETIHLTVTVEVDLTVWEASYGAESPESRVRRVVESIEEAIEGTDPSMCEVYSQVTVTAQATSRPVAPPAGGHPGE